MLGKEIEVSNSTREISKRCQQCDTQINLLQVWGTTDNNEGKLGQWTPGDEQLNCPTCSPASIQPPHATAARRTEEELALLEAQLHAKIRTLLMAGPRMVMDPRMVGDSQAHNIMQLCKRAYLYNEAPVEI